MRRTEDGVIIPGAPLPPRTSKAYFDSDGRCLGITLKQAPDLPEITHVVDVQKGTKPQDIWFNGTVVKRREIVDLALPERILVGDVREITVPDDSVIYINNVRQTGSTVTLDTTTRNALTVEVRGRFNYQIDPMVVTQAEMERLDEQVRLKDHELKRATPSEVDAYIDTNVTDLESTKDFLKLLSKLVVLE